MSTRPETVASAAPLRVVVAAQRPSDLVEMQRVALALVPRGHQVTVVYTTIRGAGEAQRDALERLDALARDDARLSVVVLTGHGDRDVEPGASESDQVIRSALRRFLGRAYWGLRQFLFLTRRRPFVGCLAEFFYVGREYLRRLRIYRRCLAEIDPDLLVLPEDVVGMVTPLLIKAGHQRGVPSLILPYTIANQEEAFRSLSTNPKFQASRTRNRLAGRLDPAWLMRRADVALIRLPAEHVLGHWLTRTTPPDPWMMNSGFADRIGVENEVMRRYYLDAGIPAERMEVVGTASDDALAAVRRDRRAEREVLDATLGLDGTLPLLLVGGCPNQLVGDVPGCEFADIEAVAGSIGRTLRAMSAHYAIVLRPHPNFVDLGAMLEPYGVRSTLIDTARLIAVADAYVAFASATIRWAIACGVPTINYDVFRYDYDDFKASAGVRHVADAREFEAALRDLEPGSARRAQWVEEVRSGMGNWGTLDGRSIERIEALMVRLVRSGVARRAAADGAPAPDEVTG